LGISDIPDEVLMILIDQIKQSGKKIIIMTDTDPVGARLARSTNMTDSEYANIDIAYRLKRLGCPVAQIAISILPYGE
jgi:5S rRNA maturation endonuclease (ribonuclease M5)